MAKMKKGGALGASSSTGSVKSKAGMKPPSKDHVGGKIKFPCTGYVGTPTKLKGNKTGGSGGRGK